MAVKDLFEKYTKASPHVKRAISYAVVGLFILLLAFYMYQGKKAHPPEKKETVKFEEVVPEVRLLQKSLYEETKRKTQKMQEQIFQLKKEILDTKRLIKEAQEQQQKKLNQQISELKGLIEQMKKQKQQKTAVTSKSEKISPPPRSARSYPYTPTTKKAPPTAPQWIGGISVQQVEKKKEQKQSKKKGKKKEKLSVYLPPSFVEADLLNGFASFSSQKGEKEPVRALFRLRDLAVLPNEIKADLKGCFAIGEARGDLSDERAHIRLLRLSCIGRDGSSVIDSPVKGWVVDEDGKAGLRGIVVTKMGAFLTRYMLAGFIQGFGEAYSSSQYYTTYSSSSGVVTLPSPGEAAKAGFGKGIARAGKGLADFYLELAKQTLPVLEVGAGKRVTLVFTEGTNLVIKKHCIKGRDGCLPLKSDFLSSLASLY